MTKLEDSICEVCIFEDKENHNIEFVYVDDGAYKFFRCEEHFSDEECIENPNWRRIQ